MAFRVWTAQECTSAAIRSHVQTNSHASKIWSLNMQILSHTGAKPILIWYLRVSIAVCALSIAKMLWWGLETFIMSAFTKKVLKSHIHSI
jgi:hypothetical protein